MAGTTDERCWLCARPLGPRVEYHHPVPKSRGGRHTEPVHPICHRMLHRTLTNGQLESIGDDVRKLRAEPEISRFLDWIAGKPPDFYVATHKRRASGR